MTDQTIKVYYHKYYRGFIYLLVLFIPFLFYKSVQEITEYWEYLDTPFEKAMVYMVAVFLGIAILVNPILFSLPYMKIVDTGVYIRVMGRLKLKTWDEIEKVQFTGFLSTPGFTDGILILPMFLSKRRKAFDVFKSKEIQIEGEKHLPR